MKPPIIGAQRPLTQLSWRGAHVMSPSNVLPTRPRGSPALSALGLKAQARIGRWPSRSRAVPAGKSEGRRLFGSMPAGDITLADGPCKAVLAKAACGFATAVETGDDLTG